MCIDVCNIVLNYLLIFGKFGLPAMGIAVGGSYFLGIVLNMGLFGIWIAQGLDECFRAVGMGIRWKKKGYTWIEVTK